MVQFLYHWSNNLSVYHWNILSKTLYESKKYYVQKPHVHIALCCALCVSRHMDIWHTDDTFQSGRYYSPADEMANMQIPL